MICSYGCEQQATTQLKNGKYCCSDSPNKCPTMRKKNSDGLVGVWDRNVHPMLGMTGKHHGVKD